MPTDIARALLVLAVGIALPAGGGDKGQGKAQGLAAYSPDQAVVLDGSSKASDAFLVSFSHEGFLLDLSESDVDCPQTGQLTLPLLFELIPGQGIQAGQGDHGLQVIPMPLLVPGQLPLALQDLEDDCDALALADQVGAYLAAVSLQAAGDFALLEACCEQARRRYCEIVSIIEGAPTLPPTASLIIETPPSFYTAPSPVPQHGGWACDRALTALEDIPVFLDDLSMRLDECGQALAELEAIQPDPYSGPGGAFGIPSDVKDSLLRLAGFRYRIAKISVIYGQRDLDVIAVLSSKLTLARLEDACAACDTSDPADVYQEGPAAVIEKLHRQPLGRFIGAFRSASNAAEDPVEADRLWRIAQRLIEVPGDRVLHVTYASTSAVGQHLVAIRSAEKPDDGVSPVVVVLTALPWRAPLPPMTTADQAKLLDAYRSFHSTLAPKGGPIWVDQ